jgi:predicted RNase H-like HicB family nuclease
MPDLLSMKVRLVCFARDDGEYWTSGCPTLDLYSQGDSAEDARHCLEEAVQLWIESCVERGTLHQALRELGWDLATGNVVRNWAAHGEVAEPKAGERFFELVVDVPAYQATLTGSVSALA